MLLGVIGLNGDNVLEFVDRKIQEADQESVSMLEEKFQFKIVILTAKDIKLTWKTVPDHVQVTINVLISFTLLFSRVEQLGTMVKLY